MTGGEATGLDVTTGGKPEAEAGERQVPFFCPYCGEEELRPAGSKGGDWECRSCARGFTLRFTGVLS
ncbi:MAG: hypothetical protein LBV34_16095 [Nocardiopsaceae bacterium]|nr:hypothetical protein [Nocardiopsaceae bacterium]